MSDKTTLVLGASPNVSRYSNMAARSLIDHGQQVILVGLRKGDIGGNRIYPIKEKILFQGVHTITVYMNPVNQQDFQSYMLSLNPQRIIFNPGTENLQFENKAKKEGVEVVFDCTLVMLQGGYY